MIHIFRLATDKDFKNIFNLYIECTRELNKQGIIQWDESYPTKEIIKNNIDKNYQFVYIKDDNLIGTFVLSEVKDEYWQKINWSEDNFIGLHLLAISPEYQNKGYGKEVMDFCEKYAKDNNYKSIHLDVFSKNKGALKLYKNRGYQKVGNLKFEFKPEDNQLYYCYEKVLKDD
ncbi:MAG: GNAT family N-acetyltransferase [Halanaerobiales bacterium]|nr:GNAT family N-acetyltransferase [Halanaerobiales bacterium]